MKKIIMIDEEELDVLLKSLDSSRVILSRISREMDKNMSDDLMGINRKNISSLYSSIQTVTHEINTARKVFD